MKKKAARFLQHASKHKNKNKRIMKEEKLNTEEQENVQIEDEAIAEESENTNEQAAQEEEVKVTDPLAFIMLSGIILNIKRAIGYA